VSDFLDRSLRLGKAYVNRVRDSIEDRLADAERNLAKDELDRSPSDEMASGGGGAAYSNDPDALMRRAEERIAAARRAAESNLELARANANGTTAPSYVKPTTATTKPTTTTTATEDPNTADYRVLGIAVGSDFVAVQAAYEKLALRCDPRRFPDNSPEQKQAEVILARVNNAYENLRKVLDPTESRFGRLELE